VDSSDFHRRFTAKGAMRDILTGVPVYVITTDYPGLIGAAHAPM
jgi:glucokinase